MAEIEKHAVGRPSKYTKELLSKCYEYMEDYKNLGDEIPSHIGLFLHIGISKTSGYDWDKEEGKEEFSAILGKCLMMQHQCLVNKGLSGDFNAAITKLVLGKHGYHDKVEQDITSGGKEIRNNFIIIPVTTKVDE